MAERLRRCILVTSTQVDLKRGVGFYWRRRRCKNRFRSNDKNLCWMHRWEIGYGPSIYLY